LLHHLWFDRAADTTIICFVVQARAVGQQQQQQQQGQLQPQEEQQGLQQPLIKLDGLQDGPQAGQFQQLNLEMEQQQQQWQGQQPAKKPVPEQRRRCMSDRFMMFTYKIKLCKRQGRRLYRSAGFAVFKQNLQCNGWLCCELRVNTHHVCKYCVLQVQRSRSCVAAFNKARVMLACNTCARCHFNKWWCLPGGVHHVRNALCACFSCLCCRPTQLEALPICTSR
jgi:hypothetical protein